MVKRTLSRLSAKGITNRKPAGYYADGGGLYLQVKQSGSKSWLFRYTLTGKPQWMGLGSVRTKSLAKARSEAEACRQLLSEGVDPIAARGAQETQEALAKTNTISFRLCAEKYVASHRADWKNAKHIDQWTNTLET